MNGPVNFYKTREIIRHDVEVSVPNNMYKMKNIHDKKTKEGPLVNHVSPFQDSVNISMQKLEDQPEINGLEERLRNIIRELDEIRDDMSKLKAAVTGHEPVVVPELNDMIVNANPSFPPYAILALQKLCAPVVNLVVGTHTHSSIPSLTPEAENLAQKLREFVPLADLPKISLRLIWKNVGPACELLATQLPICGEANVLRYFARVLPGLFIYENSDNVTDLDAALDIAYCLVQAKTKTERASHLQSLSKKLGKSQFLCAHAEITIADIAACSAIKQVAQNEVNQTMGKWLVRCEQ
ncbi:probable aminoacyl tRNA synthase complex-interacting multifunctional protein 2 isoform X2 [Photinus pyralis]|uniref:AIMP2 thioredoxin-like domain-containing protein n=1 Tax=Photinus pyralis TaxID=7054 RepID=A0A1Y1LME9_PHOPY|nr:probable aminoacyl tRNA synthase complex-interacting multifunctional protein 2 isoform X2 [Photinus pyralis]